MLMMNGSHVRVAVELRGVGAAGTTSTTTAKRNAAALSKETGMQFVISPPPPPPHGGGVEIIVTDAQLMAQQSRMYSAEGLNREWHINNKLFPITMNSAAAVVSDADCGGDLMRSLLLDGNAAAAAADGHRHKQDFETLHDQETSSILSSITVPVSQFSSFSTFPSPRASPAAASAAVTTADTVSELTQTQRQQQVSHASWYLGDGYIADPLFSNPNYMDILHYLEEARNQRQSGSCREPQLPIFDIRQFVQMHKPNRMFFEFRVPPSLCEENVERMIQASVNGVRQLLRQYGVFTCDLEHHDHHHHHGTEERLIAVYRVLSSSSLVSSWRVHVPFASVPDLRTFAILHDILLEILHANRGDDDDDVLWHRWLRYEPAMAMYTVPVVFNLQMGVCDGCRSKILESTCAAAAGRLFARCVAIDDMDPQGVLSPLQAKLALTREMLVACMAKTHTQFNAEYGVCAAVMLNSENVCDACRNGRMMQTMHGADPSFDVSRAITIHDYDDVDDDDVIDLNDPDSHARTRTLQMDDGDVYDLFNIHIPTTPHPPPLCVTCYSFGDWKHAFHHHNMRDNRLRSYGTITTTSNTTCLSSSSMMHSFVPIRNILTARSVEFSTFYIHDIVQMALHRLKQVCRDANTVSEPHANMTYAAQDNILDKLNGLNELYVRGQIGVIYDAMNVDASSKNSTHTQQQQQSASSSRKRNASGGHNNHTSGTGSNSNVDVAVTHAMSSTAFELDCSGDDGMLFDHIDAMKRDIGICNNNNNNCTSTTTTVDEDARYSHSNSRWISFARMVITVVACTSTTSTAKLPRKAISTTTSTHRIVSMCMALSTHSVLTKSTKTMVVTSKCSTPPQIVSVEHHHQQNHEQEEPQERNIIVPTPITIIHKVPVRRGRQQQQQQQQQPLPPQPPLKFTHTCSITSIVTTSPRVHNFEFIGHAGYDNGDGGGGVGSIIIPDLLLYVLSKGTSNMDIIETLRSAAHDARANHVNDLALVKMNRDISLRVQMQQQQQQHQQQQQNPSDEETVASAAASAGNLIKRKKSSIAKINNAIC